MIPEPIPSEPLVLKEILHSRVWQRLGEGDRCNHHSAIFQPVGGMDTIAKALTPSD